MNDDVLHFDLDIVEGQKDKARLRLEQYRRTWEKTYNKKVRTRKLVVGDFVLRKQFSTTAERNVRKFKANWEGPYIIREVGLGGHYKLITQIKL